MKGPDDTERGPVSSLAKHNERFSVVERRRDHRSAIVKAIAKSVPPALPAHDANAYRSDDDDEEG
jgi:hypothetical protein